jgi:hypothetical protein
LILFLDKVNCNGAYNVLDGQIRSTAIELIEEGNTDNLNPNDDYARYVDNSNGKTSFWRQYYILVSRNFILAARDPALYYLQFVLTLMFGFLIGAAFLRLKYVIGSGINNVPAGLLWTNDGVYTNF